MKILNLALGMRFSSANASQGGKAAYKSGRRFSKGVTDTVYIAGKVVFCCVSLLLTVQKEYCQLL